MKMLTAYAKAKKQEMHDWIVKWLHENGEIANSSKVFHYEFHLKFKGTMRTTKTNDVISNLANAALFEMFRVGTLVRHKVQLPKLMRKTGFPHTSFAYRLANPIILHPCG
jgi:hypothetical protein